MLAFDDNEGLEAARARNILDALREDMGQGDHTAGLVPDRPIRARLVVREPAVLCGCEWFEGCLLALDAEAQVDWGFKEGDEMPADAEVSDASDGLGGCHMAEVKTTCGSRSIFAAQQAGTSAE